MQYDESVLILDAPVDIDEDVLPFGKRWGGLVYLKRKANPVSDSGSESVPVGQRKTPGHGI